MTNKFIGLDPSYTRTGFCLIDDTEKVIFFTKFGTEIGDKTFKNLYDAASYVVDEVCNEVRKHIPTFVITETPPPSGNFGAGLFGLDMMLVKELSKYQVTVEGVSPMYIGHIHGTRSYHKSASVNLAKKILQEVFNDYSVIYSGRMSNDEAEAFLICLRNYVAFKGLKYNELLTKVPAYKDKKEFILVGIDNLIS